jgi:hypothetical protein
MNKPQAQEEYQQTIRDKHKRNVCLLESLCKNLKSKELYNKYIEETSSNITFVQWKEIENKVFSHVTDHILNTGEIIELKHGLGAIALTKRKKNFRRKKPRKLVNWHATKEHKKKYGENKVIYHTNELLASEWNVKWKWLRPAGGIANVDYYVLLTMTRLRGKTGKFVSNNPDKIHLYPELRV